MREVMVLWKTICSFNSLILFVDKAEAPGYCRAEGVWRGTALIVIIACMLAFASPPAFSKKPAASASQGGKSADEFLVVDCLLPGQLRRMGSRMNYLSPRRPVKTSASDCEIRGGEYVAFDRADYSTALNIWLPQAKE